MGFENEFTQRNTTFMSGNLLHAARLLKDQGGFPAYANQRSEWNEGRQFGFENPEYRLRGAQKKVRPRFSWESGRPIPLQT